MSRLTTDPTDPELGHGSDNEKVPQNKAYLVLSQEEIDKGFIRPVRTDYVHVGKKAKFDNEIKPLTAEQAERHKDTDYVAYVEYSEKEKDGSSVVGRYFTQEQLDHYKKPGCDVRTIMSREIAETYARDPKFYGATYCVGCSRHLPVDEFVWDGTDELVGS